MKQNIKTASKKLHGLFTRTKVRFGLNFEEFDENLIEKNFDESPKTALQKSPETVKCFKTTSLSAKLDPSKTAILPFNEKLINHFVFEPNVDRNLLKNHMESLHKDLIYATKGLKHSDFNLKLRQVALVDKKSLNFAIKIQLCLISYFLGNNKKTLLLDLDETLIHTCSLFENPQYILTIKLPEGTKTVNNFTFCFFKSNFL